LEQPQQGADAPRSPQPAQLEQIRQRFVEQVREQRGQLAARREALRRAARRLVQRKHRLDGAEAELSRKQDEVALRHSAVEASLEQIERERSLLDEQHRQFAAARQDQQEEVGRREADLAEREGRLAQERSELEQGQRRYRDDLVRLDRLQATLEQRTRQMQAQALEIDKRFEQLQRDSRELEQQAAQTDDWHTRLTGETERLARERKEQEEAAAQFDQRAAALEGQQAMLATLRTRLERMREELRRQEQALATQRSQQEASEAECSRRLEESRRLRDDFDNDRALFEQERSRFAQRQATLDEAVARLRQAQETFDAEQSVLAQRQQQLDAMAAEQGEQAERLLTRAAQLEDLHTRVAAERQTLRDREVGLVKSEQALTALQEQLRQRSDELLGRAQALEERERTVAEAAGAVAQRAEALDQAQREADQRLEPLRRELETRAAELERLGHELEERTAALKGDAQRQETSAREFAGQRLAWDAQRQTESEAGERSRADLEAARRDTLELLRQIPDLEGRTAAAVERLQRGREQLREQLAEVHNYARQSRDDLDGARKQVQAELERVRQQELDLHVARDEHRLAVAAFRQQAIEWQALVGEMKQMLQSGETRLERRQSEVDEQARQVADSAARLAAQAEALQERERQVAERRGEVTRHLEDMREWYRRKLRELSGVDTVDEPVLESEASSIPLAEPARPILPLTGDLEPGDQQLGDLLRSLRLVDDETLTVLLLEARRQRRSLRQLLLAGNYLTLYQLALIEAGNLDGLVLGPVRVVDRLQATAREAVYRVFDPRHEREAVLRHLGEAEMEDAVRPDEFRQRFGAAVALSHPQLATTYEVLDIGGRPAVLQEWLSGLSATDWPPLTAAPGVWYRLLTQAALALRTAHDAGLVHGHLSAASFVCTAAGVLKLVGLGEPVWLTGASASAAVEPTPAEDLAALGRLATAWAEAAPGRGKAKPFPEALAAVLDRLAGADGTEPFVDAAALQEELERVSDQIPANAAAWERFVKQVRESSAERALRRSA
jgi:chromosome segregation ATPase